MQAHPLTDHTHPFNGPLSGTTRVGQYQKGKTKKQETVSGSGTSCTICKSAPSSTDNHPCQHPTTQLSEAGCPSCHPTNSIKALKANQLTDQLTIINRQEGDNRVGYVRLCLASSLF